MNKIDVSLIVDPNKQQPFLGPSLLFLQGATKDVIASFLRNLIGINYNPATVYILYGCVNSQTLPNYTISAGSVFFNGEVYSCPAVTGVVAGGKTLYSAADTAFSTIATPDPVTGVNCDPVEFSDGSTASVHQVVTWKIQQLTTGTGVNPFSGFAPLFVNPFWAKNTGTQSDGSQGSRTQKYNTIITNVDGIVQTLSSTGEFTPKAGLLKVIASATLAEAGGGNTTTIAIELWKNGAPIFSFIAYRGSGSATEIKAVSAIFPIVSVGTDIYKIVYASGVATTLDITNSILIVEPSNNRVI